jgi:raffinose/stachyose/melibiose transport system substrate-binding protein
MTRTWLVALGLFAGLCTSSAVHAQEKVTLRVWDTFHAAGMNEGMDQLIAEFEAQNPDIDVVRDVQTPDDLRPIIQTALASGTGPDVFYFGTGPGFAGILADANLLMPLDEAYASQGWDHIYPWTKDNTTFDGKVYGIGNEIEFYGAYYNKQMFEQLGLKVPQTYEEFLALCEALKQAGKIPIAFANQGGWPAYHLFSVWANNFAGKEKMDELLFDSGSWDDPDIIAAIEEFFVNFRDKGYLIPETNAVAYADAQNLFVAEQAGMHISGTWALNGLLDRNPAFDIGWFFIPSPKGTTVPPAGLGSGFFVSANTKVPDAAVRYLDFLYDPSHGRTWVETMYVIPPFDVDTTGFNTPATFQEFVGASSQYDMGYNIDVQTPEVFNQAMNNGFQAVLLGQKTPAQQAADLQAAIESFRAQN